MRLSVDPLGLFPLYYTATFQSLIATGCMYLGVAEADRAPALDRAGLAGILLSNGLVGDRTLMCGWSRLAPGCELQWQPGETGRVEPTYRLPIHGHYTALAFDDARQLIDKRLSEAVRRHCPPQGTSTVLLSGGLDSRLLAGYLTAHGIAELGHRLGPRQRLRIPRGSVRRSTIAAAAGVRIARCRVPWSTCKRRGLPPCGNICRVA